MNQNFYQITLTLLILLIGGKITQAQKKDTTSFKIDNVRIIVTEEGDSTKAKKSKKGMTISLGNKGIKIGNPKKKKKRHKKLHTSMHFDFGINNIIDNSNYNGSLANYDLVIQDTMTRPLTGNDLDLLNGRSINFNFWPVWLSQDIAKHNVQIETGLGFQFFNYRYTTTVKHIDVNSLNTITLQSFGVAADFAGPGFENVTDANQLQGKKKNKLGVSYVSVPLMIRFNTNKKNGHRYFVGAGVIGSYKLKSWTKFYGDKESGNFGINDWMTQATVELGVTGIIKVYGTCALQSMYENGLDRSPFAIGIRL